MKVFQQTQLPDAVAYAMQGGQALHLHKICGPFAPRCFKAAINRGESIAHLFDQDAVRLEKTAWKLGVRILVVERRGGEGQHIDLCGKPLAAALQMASEASSAQPSLPA